MTLQVTTHRGRSVRLLVSVTRPTGPVNISAASLSFIARKRLGDADDAPTNIIKTTENGGIDKIDAAGGKALVTVDPADTSSLTDSTRYFCQTGIVEADGLSTPLGDVELRVLVP